VRIFLSHVSDEAPEARAIKQGLEAAMPGLDVFVSAVDIHLGDAWLREIDEALTDARAVLALCSPSSVRRPWINFESGSGWTRRLPVVPLCHKGLRKDQLPDPLRIFQAIELTTDAACADLVRRLSAMLAVAPAGSFDATGMAQALRGRRLVRGTDVGIVLCHRQSEWDDGERAIFALPASLPRGLEGPWTLRAMDDERAFLSSDLHALSGLIVGNPWRATMAPETVAAIVEWVRAGGRLLLLGFELGDRHHDGNLADLSRHFGVDPAGDIVGPRGYGTSKPYDEPVDFNPGDAEAHSFTEGLTRVTLANVQTLQVLPGGTEWLRVGHNVVYRPRRDSVRYRDGTMTMPHGTAFEINPEAGWLPVAAEAPRGLCGAGGVQMVGTWDLLGRRQAFGADNFTLLARLLHWLSRNTA